MNKQQIGQFVKEQRESQKLSQQALADKAQVRRQIVIEIENSTRSYTIDKLMQVLNALDVSINICPVEVFRFRKTKSK